MTAQSTSLKLPKLKATVDSSNQTNNESNIDDAKETPMEPLIEHSTIHGVLQVPLRGSISNFLKTVITKRRLKGYTRCPRVFYASAPSSNIKVWFASLLPGPLNWMGPMS
uniref:Uncharacterized protein n=1 Tax=Oryza brachyantha TaxID=4533 RepID=J3MCW5_ORYBR